jgi:hypothetical protein
MPSSGMLRHVTLVRTDVSEERSASIIRVARIGDLGKLLAVTVNRRKLRRNSHIVFFASCVWLLVTANVVPSSQILVTVMMETLRSSETSIAIRATRRKIPEDCNLQKQI